MYKAIFKISNHCIDVPAQEIFTPFINCYHLHSSTIFVNGVSYEEDESYEFDQYRTKWKGPFELQNDYDIIIELNYFYMRPDAKVLNFIIDSTYTNPDKSSEITSKHYIEGQFSLDNGLYKNAALNFGTALEALLNKDLSTTPLFNLINSYTGSADKTKMHFVRELRNKVHPNKIAETEEITRKQAIIARNTLEIILKTL
ncbi:hypothetical protein [Chryseobacterium taiwanense]|uniref:DUF4145 domain-containing protein n=1 Tax=Chryseobacterium taiwanense TaxID=363331 RepID=A0A0B4DAJ0_9FLAO|nr:hypothetical protein [Chryseobacterium taiwanense]KIC61325.1 hypothetical protein RM51_17750 [Chryseobacterium taiwanense]